MQTPKLFRPPTPRGRRGAALVITLLLLIAAIFLVTRLMLSRNEAEKAHAITIGQTEPQTSLQQFFMERSFIGQIKQTNWTGLLDCMSLDDQHWFAQSYKLMGAQGGVTDDERKYAAFMQLLRSAPGDIRPIVAQMQVKGSHAVAFIHEPNKPQTMQEVFLVSEGGLWKLRRFLGARDNPALLESLVKAKKFQGKPLDADEQAFAANPVAYAAWKRAALLRESGLSPTGEPVQ